MLKEAKQELWRKWRNKKGKKQGKEPLGMDQTLLKVEKEVENYKKEVEKEKMEQEMKKNRLKKKQEKEKHWEMLRWVVGFIEKNQENWERRRKEQIRKMDWQSMSEDEKRNEFERETVEIENKNPEERKLERLELAKRLKENWKQWRGAGDESGDAEKDFDSDSNVPTNSQIVGEEIVLSFQARGEGKLTPAIIKDLQARGEGCQNPGTIGTAQAR